MWVTNNLGYDVELSGVHLYRASQQEVTEAQATALLANATYVLLKTNGQLVQTDSQPDANAQYYVRPLDGVITLNGFPSNPNGSPEVSPLEAFDIGKEEGGSADLENNKEVTIDVSTYSEPVEVTPTSGKDGMKKATVTLDNIPSGADLEANHAATINVSTYTDPVEITPTQGKDGMEKVTITLTNIPQPSGGGGWYCWSTSSSTTQLEDETYVYLPFASAPNVIPLTTEVLQAEGQNYVCDKHSMQTETSSWLAVVSATKVSANEIELVLSNSGGMTLYRNAFLAQYDIPSSRIIAPYCYELITYDQNNIIVCDGEIELVSGIYDNGYIHNTIVAPFDFVDSLPVIQEGNRSILQEWRSISLYAHIIPSEEDNPSEFGWYEYDESQEEYVTSGDTEVDPTKIYYIEITSGEFVNSVRFSNNGSEYILAGGQNESMNQFIQGPVPLAE